VGGRPYASYAQPICEVGALLDAGAAHGSRTARSHLRALAVSNGLGGRRVEEVLEQTGIAGVAHRRVRTFSLGMRQRLGVAAALLGDPAVLMLDEPSNGLDPEGIIWIRELLRGLAGEGRTVLVSSHLMSETAVLADHLVVLGRGRLLADTPLREFVAARGGRRVRLRTSDDTRLSGLLRDKGLSALREDDGRWIVEGASVAEVGALAAGEAVPLLELSDDAATLEQAYLDLTAEAAEYASAAPSPTREG
jgi:ABC-2 type transport system ATP-binding protein